MSNYYEILGVAKAASNAEIKSAYRKLALKYHPDRNSGDQDSEDRFKKISEAYAVLSDPDKKRQYDTFGSTQFHQNYSQDDIFQGADFSSIFRDMGFGQGRSGGGGFEDILGQLFGGGGFRNSAAKGHDFESSFQISFLESYFGAEKTIKIAASSLAVKIPAGVKDGARLRLARKGGKSPFPGGERGDLYLKISVASHPVFLRKGDNIEVPLCLRLSELLLGTKTAVETPAGSKQLKVPAGIKPGTKLRMKGLGFSQLRGHEKGHLFVVVEVAVPKNITEQQKKIAEQLREAGL